MYLLKFVVIFNLFSDTSKKTKSKIPRATNKVDKENFTDINVSSVTQAVQNSLRK